ncbi:uncharacterized protein LOC113311998 [Papaver somniferum]|uniref:uncharacterized protein LOC113311998 n=1 Tax=Papaver somniferum TaxID=3469 RepID=UPI000E6FED6A|nr:uncharacterized protein LOC113311998 [Papaver somniferum]
MYKTIHTIRDDQGNWLENIDQVSDLLTRHSTKFFTSSSPSTVDIEDSLKQIHDNIIITHEILHAFKKKKENAKNGHISIKFDLSKAFDRLEWSFIIDVFKKLGFSEAWYQMIHQCISTVSYSVLVLSQLLLKAEEKNVIQGFKFKKNSPFISHLFFADDCILFARASITYARNIMKIINVFAKASGTPLFIGRDKTKSFHFLIESFYSRLSSTKKTNLNIAGRTVVAKHVLSSLAIYHKACFPLPKSVTSKIDAIQRTFWWSKKNPRHAAYFRSWGDLGKCKLSGGLGIRNTHATNRVFICKLGWRILKNPSLLLSSFLKDKYFPNQNLMEIDKAADSSSWIWKGIINGLKFLKANSVIKIGNGASTNIWNTVWIPVKSTYKVFVNDIVSSDDSDFWKKVWGIDCLPKIKFFLWKIFASMLPVNTLIHIYNQSVDILCPLCQNHEDSAMHLFIECPVAAHIWFDMSLEHLISSDLEWIDDLFLYWHSSDLSTSPYNVSWPSIGDIVMWCIWKLRCDVLFRHISMDLPRVIINIKRMINSCIAPQHIIFVHISDHKFLSSEVDHFLFVDGSYKEFNMGLGVIWCDCAGNVKISRADFGLISDAVGAEAAALLLAISWAEEMNLSKVVFGRYMHDERPGIKNVPNIEDAFFVDQGIAKPMFITLLHNFAPSSIYGLQFSAVGQTVSDLSEEEAEDVSMEVEGTGDVCSSSENGDKENSQSSKPNESNGALDVDRAIPGL